MQDFGSKIKCDLISAKLPSTGKILKLEPKNQDFGLLEWLKENKKPLEDNLIKFGGILFRNFNLESLSEFNKAVQIICPNLIDYTYRSTPRTKLGGKIYTATEYPKERSIAFHNENSYSRSWPNKIFFYSAIVAEDGGETPIADSRNVYEAIDSAIKQKFEKKGVLYIRNYTPGIDLSWQEVFQTENKEEVNKYCKNNQIEFEWLQEGGAQLRTKQVCQVTIKHPYSEQKVWFNQAHLFHVSALDNMDHQLLKTLGEENLPRNAFYGDGESIEKEVLMHIREIYNTEKIKFKWQKGDLMCLDNILMAHSREPYKGTRKVAVAMG